MSTADTGAASAAPHGDCSCHKCVACCSSCPGWFLPGEAEKAAALLGMEPDDFKRTYCIVDYWVGGAETLRPAKVNEKGRWPELATFSSAWCPARCVLLENDRCRIHDAKPHECKMVYGCKPTPTSDEPGSRYLIQKAWAEAGARGYMADEPDDEEGDES